MEAPFSQGFTQKRWEVIGTSYFWEYSYWTQNIIFSQREQLAVRIISSGKECIPQHWTILGSIWVGCCLPFDQ